MLVFVNSAPLLQISYVSASPSLTDKKRFPRFFRVSSPDQLVNPARIEMMKEFNWHRVATIHESTDLFSKVRSTTLPPPPTHTHRHTHCLWYNWRRVATIHESTDLFSKVRSTTLPPTHTQTHTLSLVQLVAGVLSAPPTHTHRHTHCLWYNWWRVF